MKNFSFILVALLLCTPSPCFSQEYLTVEERNRQAIEDMQRMMEDMKRMNEQVEAGTYEPPKIDYSQYEYVFDFKNVFGKIQLNQQPQNGRDRLNIWQKNEREKHLKAIEELDFDIIVLPVQDFSKSNDAISRLLSAKSIAQSLENELHVEVLEPEMIMRIAGDTKLVYDDILIGELAEKNKANIVHLFLEKPIGLSHNGKRDLYNELAVVVSDNTGAVLSQAVHRFGMIKDQEPLEVKISSLLPEIISQIKGSPVKENEGERKREAEKNHFSGKIDESFTTLLKNLRTPADHAACLQFIALLTPPSFLPERNYYFARSLLLLQQENQSNPVVKALTARALHHLHRRPLAMEYIASGNTPEINAVREYLNGNYLSLKNVVDTIDSPLLYCLSFLEFFALSESYGKHLPEADSGKIDGGWITLLKNATRSENAWYMADDLELLDAMSKILPELEGVARDVATSLAHQNLQPETGGNTILLEALVSRFGELAVENPESLYQNEIVKEDIVAFCRNLLVDRLLKQFERVIWLQARHEAGISLGEELATILSGLPRFSIRLAQGFTALARTQPTHKKHYYHQKAYESACCVVESSPHHDTYNEQARKLIAEIKKEGFTTEEYCNIPSSGRFPSSINSHHYSAYDFTPLLKALRRSKNDGTSARYEEELSMRFDGNPDKLTYICTNLWDAGLKEKAIDTLWQAIRQDRQRWNIHDLLGDYLLAQGDYGAAGDAYFSYHGFEKIPENGSVGFSHRTFAVGMKFFNHGRVPEAVPFFRFCSSIGTGSGSEMKARNMLSLIEKDYGNAAEISLRQWQRYESVDALTNYIQMSVLLEDEKDAVERGIQILKSGRTAGSEKNGELIDAVATGIRKQSLPAVSLAGLNDFIQNPKVQEEVYKNVFGMALIDRQPTRILQEDVKSAAPLVEYTPNNRQGLAGILGEDGKMQQITESVSQQKDLKRVADNYAGLYQAILLMHQNRYDEALRFFMDLEQTDSRASLFGYSDYARFAFPYVIKAVIKSSYFDIGKLGELVELKKTLKGVTVDRYEDFLTYALHCAVREDMQGAIEHLQASRKRLQMYGNQLRWYQFVALTEWLYKETKHRAFLKTALDAAEYLSLTHPYYSWPHAFVALHGENDDKRIEAAGYALHLDGGSRWLQDVPEHIKRQGEKFYEESILKGKNNSNDEESEYMKI